MARYVRDYIIKEQPDELIKQIEDYISSEGYCIEDLNGQLIYKKLGKSLSAPSFIKLKYEDNILRFQVWLKLPILPNVFVGEYDLQGVIGEDVKGPLIGRIKQIELFIDDYIAQKEQEKAQAEAEAAEETEEAAEVVAEVVAEEADVFCINCGAKNKNTFVFCAMCGQKITRFNNTNDICQDDNIIIKDEYITKRAFIKTKARRHLLTEIRIASIILYSCLGLSILLSIIQNPLALVDLAVMLALTLFAHIKKSKACAIALLCVSSFEMIISLIVAKVLGGWLLVGLSIWMVTAFVRIDKQYKDYIKNL